MFGTLPQSRHTALAWARVAACAITLGLVTGCVAVVWRIDDPRLVRGTPPEHRQLEQGEDPAARAAERREKAHANLHEKIGEPFPDLTLINKRGEVVRLSSFHGRRVAVLAAIAPFVTTSQWMQELESRDWQAPSGFDDLVILVSHGGDRSWKKQLKNCPKVYLVGWPLEGFLAQWRVYPTMYGVAADGTFEGFWSYGQQVDIGGVQSNNALKLTVRPVTVLACARSAPDRPAA